MHFNSLINHSEDWVKQLNTIAETTGLHSILVMASLPTTMKVVFANHQPIYNQHDEGPKSVQEGCHELYCERVVTTKKPLLITYASVLPEWMNNEDLIKFGLGTYLGFPILFDNNVIGTVCALNKEEFDFQIGSPSAYQQLVDLKDKIEQAIILSA